VTVTTDKKTEDDQPSAHDVSDDAGTTEPEAESPEQPTPARRRRALLAAGIAVFVALVAVSGVLGWQLWQSHQVTQAGQQARDAAVSYAQVLTSIDSDKVDENFDQVLAGATGEFKDMYSESSVQLRQLLIDNKATAHGVVVESAVQSAAKDRVVVLLFVDQSVANASVPDPRVDRSRIKMTMEKVDGQWRAAKVELP
jgi:Mce-associated membrane protein